MSKYDEPNPAARAAATRDKLNQPSLALTHATICGTVTRSGDPCKRAAGWGTEHDGFGPCKSHDKGWANMRGDTRAEKYARPLLAKLTGYDVDVNPLDALLMAVRIAAAETAYFTERIDMLGEDALTSRPTVTRTIVKQRGEGDVEKHVVKIEQQEELNLWIKARKASMRDMAQFSKMALDAGVEERMVRVAEGVGEALATAVRGILDDMGLTDTQRDQAPDIVRKHLRLLQIGSGVHHDG